AAQALCQLGNLLAREGERETARELHERSLALREAAEDARGIGLSLLALSVGAAADNDVERARSHAERALALFDRTDDGPGQGATLMQLGYIAADAGELPAARGLLERALATWQKFIPNAIWCGGILLELVDVERALGEPTRAQSWLRVAL